MQVRPYHLLALVCITVTVHAFMAILVVPQYTTQAPQPPTSTAHVQVAAAAPAESAGAPSTSGRAVGSRPRILIATATQPAPCTTAHGDHVIGLSLKNKLQYATLHGYAVWPSTELLSPWDLGGQWNKVALLSILMDEAGGAYDGEWIMWMDDDAIFCDMRFTFPLDAYDAAGIDLVMWGDDKMTYEQGDSEGINTGAARCRPRIDRRWIPLLAALSPQARCCCASLLGAASCSRSGRPSRRRR